MRDHHERNEDGLVFSTDRDRLDIDLIHGFLARESYWVPDIRREFVERAIDNSLCFGIYEDNRQLAFARAVTDCAGFAWLADVFVVGERRGDGLGQRLIAFILAHPQLRNIRRFMLATRDAHGLYAQHGFTPLSHPEHMMERYDPDALSR
jgi:GNAT superfamily N-acetyltransferase